MKANIADNPVNIGLFGLVAIVFSAHPCAELIHQPDRLVWNGTGNTNTQLCHVFLHRGLQRG